VSLSELLHRVVRMLDDCAIPYMLTGSLAAAYYATPRATKDIDIVFEADEARLSRLTTQLHEAGLYVDEAVALEALRTEGQFNAIDPASGWKIDLIVRKERPFSRAEFERREAATVLGIDAKLATVEDVLIAKLEWAKLGDSELQRRDVIELLERVGHRLDLGYIERWVGPLDLETEWRTARARADLSRFE
jgi:transposase InsO family protein